MAELQTGGGGINRSLFSPSPFYPQNPVPARERESHIHDEGRGRWEGILGMTHARMCLGCAFSRSPISVVQSSYLQINTAETQREISLSRVQTINLYT